MASARLARTPEVGGIVAVELRLAELAVDLVVHLAHPASKGGAAHRRLFHGTAADDVEERLGARGARVEPHEAMDEARDARRLVSGRARGMCGGKGVQKGSYVAA